MSPKQLALSPGGSAGGSTIPHLRTELVTVTPKMAAEFLSKLDPRQRPVNLRVVDSYAEQLRDGLLADLRDAIA